MNFILSVVQLKVSVLKIVSNDTTASYSSNYYIHVTMKCIDYGPQNFTTVAIRAVGKVQQTTLHLSMSEQIAEFDGVIPSATNNCPARRINTVPSNSSLYALTVVQKNHPQAKTSPEKSLTPHGKTFPPSE
jgi:hypothetical protein